MATSRLQHRLARTLTVRYSFALLTLAFLAIMGQILVQSALSRQSHDHDEINLAETQRTQSHSLAKTVLSVIVASGRPQELKDLDESIQELSRSLTTIHKELREGNASLGIRGAHTEQARQILASIDPNFQALMATRATLSAQLKRAIVRQGTLSQNTFRLIRKILAQEEPYRNGIDHLVLHYQMDSSRRIGRLRTVESVLLAMTLITLLLEAFLIFRPVIQELGETVNRLEMSEARKSTVLQNSPDSIITFGTAAQFERHPLRRQEVFASLR